MSAGDRIIHPNIYPGRFILQPDREFTESEYGFDNGVRYFVTHPDTPKSAWPQRNQPDAEYPRMYVRQVIPRTEDSGLIFLTVLYRGIMRFGSTSDILKEHVTPSAPVSIFTLPALQSSNPVRIVAPVPKPQVSRSYLTLTAPTLNGISGTAVGTFLPGLPSFLISYTPDPDQTPTVNYSTGWKLDDRSYDNVADQVWLVDEFYSYYFSLAT